MKEKAKPLSDWLYYILIINFMFGIPSLFANTILFLELGADFFVYPFCALVSLIGIVLVGLHGYKSASKIGIYLIFGSKLLFLVVNLLPPVDSSDERNLFQTSISLVLITLFLFIRKNGVSGWQAIFNIKRLF